MPRVAIDYSKTVIYRISHKEVEGLDYVGSTTDFTRRKASHKSSCNNPNSQGHHLKVYETIRENGGWDAFRMLEIKKFPCVDNREAEAEEERCRKELKAALNMIRAFVTGDEIKDDKKQYYERNREIIIEKAKLYTENHKENVAEYQKKYREQNKDKARERESVTYICECCLCLVRQKKKFRHELSQRHLKNAQIA